jgi:uncharacterized protein (TIGR02284 family)
VQRRSRRRQGARLRRIDPLIPFERNHMTSKMNMTDPEVVTQLNDLIENCKDGEYGFRTCAEHAHSEELKRLLNARADNCQQAARELQEQVVQHGGKAETTGTAGGAVHRGWVAVRGALSGYTDAAILSECERGEDVAVARYRKVLEWPLPAGVKELVERQYQGVKRNHDQVRSLRDQYKAAA